MANEEYSYYLGYYVHLVTDQYWSKLHNQKKDEKPYQAIIDRPDYYNILKKDWYGLDFLYLAEHPDHIFWTEFQHINEFPEYLDIFPKGQTLVQIKNITKFYQKRKPYDNHQFIYLTASEIDQFVTQTTEQIYKTIKHKIEG